MAKPGMPATATVPKQFAYVRVIPTSAAPVPTPLGLGDIAAEKVQVMDSVKAILHQRVGKASAAAAVQLDAHPKGSL